MFGIRDKKLSPYMTENVHEELIRLENLVKIYDTGAIKVLGLKKISLTIRRGEFVAIMGHSGSGKSTLMNILGCLDRPTMGHYYLDGIDTAELDPNELSAVRNLKIGFVFQSFNLISRTSALKNVELPMTYARIPKRKRAERAMELLECVGLGARADHMPNEMSGGQRQRVAIARALATDPKVLLCDEATSALDPTTTLSILDLLKELNQKLGVTVVVITHQMNVIEEICHRVAILDHGVVAEQDTVEEIFSNPKTDIGRQLVYPNGVRIDQLPPAQVIRVAFNGGSSYEPLIASLAIDCGVKVNILGADTRNVNGKAFGSMLLGLPEDHGEAVRAMNYLKAQKDVTVEEVPDYHG